VGHESQAMQTEKLRRPRDAASPILRKWSAVSIRGYRTARMGVAKDSQVETFAGAAAAYRYPGAGRKYLHIRTGKVLTLSATEVIVNLKSPPLAIFDASAAMPTNYYRLRLSPKS